MGVDAVGVEADSSENADEVAVMAEAAVAATMIRLSPTILSMELTFGTGDWDNLGNDRRS